VRLGSGQDQGTYLSAFHRQIMRRQGKHKAIMALTHKILVIAWNLLTTGALYDDPGTTAPHKRSHEQLRCCAILRDPPTRSPRLPGHHRTRDGQAA
jgi:hypothetical protein